MSGETTGVSAATAEGGVSCDRSSGQRLERAAIRATPNAIFDQGVVAALLVGAQEGADLGIHMSQSAGPRATESCDPCEEAKLAWARVTPTLCAKPDLDVGLNCGLEEP